MKLTFHLQRTTQAQETTASVAGDVLTISGATFDFGVLKDGDEAHLDGDHPFIGPIRREKGEIHATFVWHYDGTQAAPDQGSSHPTQTIDDGPVANPVKRLPVEEKAQ